MKKTIFLLTIFILLIFPVSAWGEGFIEDIAIGTETFDTSPTDIKVLINNSPIPALNINGYMAVIVQDLKKYGFTVDWIADEKALLINRNEFAPLGEPVTVDLYFNPKKVMYTDIKTYVNNRTIPSYNIGGKMAVLINDLTMFGKITWEQDSRTLKLDLNPKEILNPLPVKMRILDNNKIFIKNMSSQRFLKIAFTHAYYNLKENKIYLSEDSIIGVDGYEEKTQFINLPSHLNYNNYIYISTILYYLEDYGSYSSIDDGKKYYNPTYQEEINFFSSKRIIDEILQLEEVLKNIQASELKANNYVPLKITDIEIGYNSIGIPQPSLKIENLSNKTVDALEVTIKCYDTYGRPVPKMGYGNNLFYGIAQNITLKNGYSDWYTWTLNLYENTTKIDAFIRSVHFTDGTVWKR